MAGDSTHSPQFRMTDHVAIVTGGAQNIGEAIARTFSGAGAKVMIADLNGDKAAATAAAIAEETGNPVRGIGCDVTVEADIERCVAETVAAFGGISTLVNNVGWGAPTMTRSPITPDEMIESYKLNTISAMRMTAACRPHLLKAKNATITNSGSMVGALPAFDFLAYSRGQGRAQPADARPGALLREAGARQLRADRHRAHRGLRRRGPRREGPGALAAPEQPDRPGGHAPGRRQRDAVAGSPAGGWVSGQTIHVHGGGARVRLKPE